MNDWLNYAKEKIAQGKQDAFVWYSIASRWFMMASLLLYAASCIVTGGMVGPVRFVEFLNNACHFGQAAQVTAAQTEIQKLPTGKTEIESGNLVSPEVPKHHKAPVLNPDSSF